MVWEAIESGIDISLCRPAWGRSAERRGGIGVKRRSVAQLDDRLEMAQPTERAVALHQEALQLFVRQLGEARCAVDLAEAREPRAALSGAPRQRHHGAQGTEIAADIVERLHRQVLRRLARAALHAGK